MEPQATKTSHRRGNWTRPEPSGEPACPGCGRAVELSQPDIRQARQLLGVCHNPACECWTVFTKVEGRWHVVRRISAEDRRSPEWTPARPVNPETASRGRPARARHG